MSPDTIREVEAFLFKEAQLADESQYSAWEELVDDDMIYWVPIGDGNYDPNKKPSVTYDNRARLATRIRQLNTGARHAQLPVSPMRRLISNIEINSPAADEYVALSNFVIVEAQIQATHNLYVWAGRTEHRLRRKGGGLKLFYKKVHLVNAGEALPAVAFIL
jgi:3-phenylpropionate/cinnamic acid dioxygenase small subunit